MYQSVQSVKRKSKDVFVEIDDFLRDLGYREAETSGGTEFVGGLRSDVNQWMGGHCGLALPRSRKSPPDLVECDYKYDLHRELYRSKLQVAA